MSTIDKILEEKGIEHVDFLKIDVQGAELLVLDGAKKTLQNTEFILLEVSSISTRNPESNSFSFTLLA